MESFKSILLLAFIWVGNQSEEANSNDTRARRNPVSKTTSCPCGLSSNKGRVIGGSQTLPNEYPWVARLVRNTGLVPVCGATIITERIAITAAHCTVNKEPSSLRAGTSDSSKSGVLIPLKGYSIQDWNPDRRRTLNDISLLYMAHPITFSATISPVCLPTKKLNLNKKWVKLIGGPVVWLDPETSRYTLVGLVSFGSPKCETTIPTVNTDVSAFIPWIRSTIHTVGCHKV